MATKKPNKRQHLIILQKFTTLELVLLLLVITGLAVFGGAKAVEYNNQRRNVLTATEQVVAEKLAEVTSTLDLVPGGVDGSSPEQPASDTPASTQPSTNQKPVSTGGGSAGSANPASAAPTPQNVPSTSPENGDTPLVALTYPAVWGQTVSGVINITATASDSSGINRVVFMIRKIGNATPVFTYADYSAPYGISFDTTVLPNGGSDYTVEAQAFDNVGTGNMASHRINIQN